MTDLAGLFLNNLLPIFLAAGIGYLAGDRLKLSPRTLSQVVFYIFSPCLIFTLLVKNNLNNRDVLGMMGFATLVILGCGVIAWLASRLLKFDRTMTAAVLLGSMFMNAGNYGLPVTKFAFGEQALAYATIFFVTSSMLSSTVGVVIASMGSMDFLKALTNLFKIPIAYALILGLVFLQTGWVLPTPISRTVEILGNAAIPCMLLILGLQFRAIRWREQAKPLVVMNAIRLLAGPAIALVAAQFFQLSQVSSQAAILEAAMPTAVMTIILATEYHAMSELVTASVATSTLISIFTITPLMKFLTG